MLNTRADIRNLLRGMTTDELLLELRLVRSELDHREGRKKFQPAPSYLRMMEYP